MGENHDDEEDDEAEQRGGKINTWQYTKKR